MTAEADSIDGMCSVPGRPRTQQAGRYPAFARWIGGRTPAGEAGQFDYTLGWLLDGIAAHLA